MTNLNVRFLETSRAVGLSAATEQLCCLLSLDSGMAVVRTHKRWCGVNFKSWEINAQQKNRRGEANMVVLNSGAEGERHKTVSCVSRHKKSKAPTTPVRVSTTCHAA